MSIKRIQTCEMCGLSRGLSETESPDTSGWRTLSNGNREVTICNYDVAAIVDHALARTRARKEETPGMKDDKLLSLMFAEADLHGTI